MPRRILILLAVLLLFAASAFARTFGKGSYVSFEFPPVRPVNPPIFSFSGERGSLDDNWQFVSYLLDADTTQPNYANYLNALPVGMEFMHQGRGFIATLHTVFRTNDGGTTWRNLDTHPAPPLNNPSEYRQLRAPTYVSSLAARPVTRDSIRYDTLFMSTTNSAADTGTVQLIYWQNDHHLYPVPQLRTMAWLTNVVSPDSFACYAIAGLDGRLFGNDSLRGAHNWREFYQDKVLLRPTRQDTLNFNQTWVGGVSHAGNLVMGVGSHHWVSRDSGRFWVIRPAADSLFDNCVSFCDSLHGMTGGGTISPQHSGWVHITTNGGRTWSGRVLQTNMPVRAVQMVTPQIGFAAGGDYAFGIGRIWRTTDGGATWNLDITDSAEFKCLAANRINTAYVDVFAAGVYSDFRGGVWRTRVYAPDLNSAVVIVDPDTLDFGTVGVGEQDTLWTVLRNIGAVTDTIYSVFVPAPFSRIWDQIGPIPIESGQELPLGIVFSPTQAGRCDSAIVIRTRTTGYFNLRCRGDVPDAATNASAALPLNTALSVYPNPGNASFEIRFDVPREGTVRLSVFDINGRLVENLAQENFTAGSHTRIWNAANFASGTYFVRLDVLNGTMTRKLVLLK